jgi:diadenosine tetraphosphate (Ap4A) HIT family hydrolase
VKGAVGPEAQACPECALARGDAAPGLAVQRRGPFLVHRRPEPASVPGWLVVAPVRHVERIDALGADELRQLGPLLAEVAAALRAETPCEKVYLSVFAEVLPHLHVHVIARPPGLPAQERGPRIFLSEARVEAAEAEGLALRVQARLRAARSDRAVLLSALVCPGAGQLHDRQYLKGGLLVGLALAATGVFLWTAVREIFGALPAEPSGFGPAEALILADQIVRRVTGPFLLFTAVVTVLWGISVLDLYRSRR